MSQADELKGTIQQQHARLSVEQLAEQANLSVDTIRFYQTRGLLEPPSRTGRQALYDVSHLERLNEIRELQKSGLSLNTIRRIFNKDVQEADKALFAELVKPIKSARSSHYLTIEELSEKTSIPIPLLKSLINEGLIPPIKINGVEVFPASDVEMARAGLALLESGIPLADLLELAKRHHAATRDTALLAITLFDNFVRNPILQSSVEQDPSKSLIDAFNRLLPAAVSLVAGHFERTLLSLAQSHLEKVGVKEEIDAVRQQISPADATTERKRQSK